MGDRFFLFFLKELVLLPSLLSTLLLSRIAPQGIRSLELSRAALEAVFADMSNAAAMESLLVGELPECSAEDADTLLGSYGLLGTTLTIPEAAAEVTERAQDGGTVMERWRRVGEAGTSAAGRAARVFRAQQRRLSVDEMGTYEAHVAAAEEMDEDFFGNFS